MTAPRTARAAARTSGRPADSLPAPGNPPRVPVARPPEAAR